MVSILWYLGYADLGGGMEIGVQVGTLGGGLNAVCGDREVMGRFEVGESFRGAEVISPMSEECLRGVGGVLEGCWRGVGGVLEGCWRFWSRL
jgi:hypothetical protein